MYTFINKQPDEEVITDLLRASSKNISLIQFKDRNRSICKMK